VLFRSHQGRFFKKPDAKDLRRFDGSARAWRALETRFVPDQSIPAGDETDRLHRWGYRHYRDLFNERQLRGLEFSCRLIADVQVGRLRRALATNLSDLLRYQNMLCRYDTMALKSLDIFSIHGFPVGLVQCESNLLGIANGRGVNVGSGGWMNIVEKYARAKAFCDAPFEVRRQGSHAVRVPIVGEWIGERRDARRERLVALRCANSASLQLKPSSLDAVLTDPPYFGNVQYGELMDFCYVWLRRLVGTNFDGFQSESSRSPKELTGNVTEARGLEQFTDGLSSTYRAMARALKPGAPLAFTFHHNSLEAYFAVGVAILDAGLVCSATLPCPAEMGGSIHIHGTGSSIVDSVFVCRAKGEVRRSQLFDGVGGLKQIVYGELAQLSSAGMTPTEGDIRCIVYGHLTRMAVWQMHKGWNATLPTEGRLERFGAAVGALGQREDLIAELARSRREVAARASHQTPLFAQVDRDAVSF
jgi:putative DNA methylase